MTPPVVMVVTACVAVLFTFDYRAADEHGMLVSDFLPLPSSTIHVAAHHAAGFDEAMAAVQPPIPIQSTVPVSPSPDGNVGHDLARACEYMGPPVPTWLASDDNGAPRFADDAEARQSLDVGVYGPPLPPAGFLEPAGLSVEGRQGDFDASVVAAAEEIVGPPVPAALFMSLGGEFFGPPVPPELVAQDMDGDVFGPPLPADFALLQDDGDVSDVALFDSDHGEYGTGHRGLPFDPLAVALEKAPDVEEKVLGPREEHNPFEKFLAEENEYDTVTYTRELTHRLRFGETMSEVLEAAGLNPREVEEWISATRRSYNLNKVYAGQELSLVMQMPESELRRMSLDIDHTTRLVAERDQGKVTARREEIPYQRHLRVAGGRIDRSLYVSAVKQGVPDKIISEIAEILGWEVNFGALYPGASFRVAYEELARTDTAESTPGRVLAVEIENRERRYEGFFFRMPDGTHAGYYNRRGEALGRSFLRYPVAYSRISSQFSRARFHPVLKRRVPHYGVDFAAPPGTPVKVVADGTVEKAGWYGGNGRFVKIRHDRLYQTGYAHLSRIARGLKAGAHVKKGQIIGYVGSSGLATGPHLHFAMYRSGKYVDPLKANLPRPHPLDGNALAGFRMTLNMMERAYAKAGLGRDEETTRVATASAGE